MFTPSCSLPTPVKAVIIGGAEDKEGDKVILQQVWLAAGGKQARILIVPTASGEPEILGEIYRTLFNNLGCIQVQVLNVTSRPQAESIEAENALRNATAVFLTGGDQVRLVTILAHTRFGRSLRQLWQDNCLLIAGTSAGASAFGACMIAWGVSGESPRQRIVELTTGMGLLPSLIIDQHFFNRNRLARLITAVTANPGCLGLGIDENTAVMLSTDNVLEVIGEGSVTIVDGTQLTYSNVIGVSEESPLSVHDLKLHILVKNARFHLTKHQVMPG
jgi:cyanophycinase